MSECLAIGTGGVHCDHYDVDERGKCCLCGDQIVIETTLPSEATDRKNIPMCTGLLDYFTAALAEVAKVSKVGNDQHNPGRPLHWARGKSVDHADCIMRHLADRGKLDTDGQLHTAKVAWRALALLQEELEAAGAPRSRGSKSAQRELLKEPGQDSYKCSACEWRAYSTYGGGQDEIDAMFAKHVCA